MVRGIYIYIFGKREKMCTPLRCVVIERERPSKEGRRHTHPKTFCNRKERERE